MNTSKSYCSYFLGLYAAMLSDIAEQSPDIHADCERDYKRLLLVMENHGIPFLTDTMVQFAKHFDRCLADGRLTSTGLTHFGPYKRGGVIPRLFKGLLLRVFHKSGLLRSVPDVQSIRRLRELLMLGKSLKIACPDSRIYENVREFFETDAEVLSPSLSWDDDWLDLDSISSLSFRDYILSDPLFDGLLIPGEGSSSIEPRLADSVQRTADVVSSFLGRFIPSDWKPRHGPGAVSDLKGNSYKYNFPSWSDRLEMTFPYADFAHANYSLWSDHIQHESDNHALTCESPSKMIAVPKTYRAPRLIASEPTANQWCQQIIRDFLMSRISHTPISSSVKFHDQSWNGLRALEASHTGEYATIDLSSASDRISCRVVERLFRRNTDLLRAMHSCRVRYITQDLDKASPSLYRLRKFSTMGSALTFPVQTILFTVIAIGCILYYENKPLTIRSIKDVSRRVRVFGDDIIVPNHVSELVMDTLVTFGLKVNIQKSFWTGKFRESCGVDAYDGHDVTKVNVNHVPSWSKPESVLSAVDCHNSLYLRGYFGTANFIKKTIEAGRRYVFPPVMPGSGTIGWYTYDALDYSHLRDRWNPRLHRREYSVTRSLGTRHRGSVDCNSAILQYFVEAAGQRDIHGDRIGNLSQRCPLKLRRTWVELA
ncbi:MAG: putative replicase protein [Alehxovirus pseudonemoriscola]|uniref:RNA-directed RNA polymerase n=1 Tax=Leviviridae sp. TaxID=2027243 RepID=A0ABY3SU94_9VIRU|nr:MAG: putative replicase protein [Leviviridae sp.]